MKRVQRIAAAGVRQAWLWRNRSAFCEAAAAGGARLFVDVSTIMRRDARTGIQRVVRAVWSELRRRAAENLVVQPVFATSARGYCLAPAQFLSGISSDWRAEPVKVHSGDKFLGLDLAAHLLPRYRRQLAAWKTHGATIHLMLYDLLPLTQPEWFSAATTSNFRKWIDVLVNDADQAICISSHVAQALRSHLTDIGRAGPEIVQMRMGADIAASIPSTGISPEVSHLLEKLRFRPTILMVGTVEPRKGYDVVLAAFESLWQSFPSDAPDLIIVGKPGWKTASIQRQLRIHPQRGRRLHWLTEVSDEALCSLYSACTGVVIASRGEGFGLPLIEAAQFRRHVLARDLPVFREHRLANASYFQDDYPASLAGRLMDLARAGKAGPAPAADLALWSDCVDGLLREIGLPQTRCRETRSPLRKAS
ncbi:MAG TPA: glycosyltransferase [Sphingomicrobium sp.]|nr:glycosyltransferase [Sphingomicrobium sp.]